MPAAGARYPSIWCTIATTNWRADRAIRLTVPLQFAAPSPRVSPGGFAGLSSHGGAVPRCVRVQLALPSGRRR
jgi:hypothetical protein